MKINFDINNTPPTQGEIDDVRIRLEKYSSTARRYWPLVFLVSIGAGYLGWGLVHWLMTLGPTTVHPGVVFFVASIGAIAGAGNLLFIANCWLEGCTAEIKRLSVIDSSVADEALRLTQAHTAIEHYRIEVVRSGRRLTNGEYLAMKKFSDDARVKAMELSGKEQMDAAFEKLHQA